MGQLFNLVTAQANRILKLMVVMAQLYNPDTGKVLLILSLVHRVMDPDLRKLMVKRNRADITPNQLHILLLLVIRHIVQATITQVILHHLNKATEAIIKINKAMAADNKSTVEVIQRIKFMAADNKSMEVVTNMGTAEVILANRYTVVVNKGTVQVIRANRSMAADYKTTVADIKANTVTVAHHHMLHRDQHMAKQDMVAQFQKDCSILATEPMTMRRKI